MMTYPENYYWNYFLLSFFPLVIQFFCYIQNLSDKFICLCELSFWNTGWGRQQGLGKWCCINGTIPGRDVMSLPWCFRIQTKLYGKTVEFWQNLRVLHWQCDLTSNNLLKVTLHYWPNASFSAISPLPLRRKEAGRRPTEVGELVFLFWKLLWG